MLEVDSHPLLDYCSFVSRFPFALSDLDPIDDLVEMMKLDFEAPLQSSDEVRKAVRDLLRHGGFKPTGRSKPASEYLIKAAANEKLGSINLAVDVCNIVSLHSGLPISVVDLDLVDRPLRIAIAEKEMAYVFNQSGQAIDIGGLLCLFDAEGPCANAVKDSQRTKTRPVTTRTLSVVWGTNQLPGKTQQTSDWYQRLLAQRGVAIEAVNG